MRHQGALAIYIEYWSHIIWASTSWMGLKISKLDIQNTKNKIGRRVQIKTRLLLKKSRQTWKFYTSKLLPLASSSQVLWWELSWGPQTQWMSCPLCVCPAAGHPPHMWSPWSGSGRPSTSLGPQLCPWSETERVRAFYPGFQVFGYPTRIRWWPHRERTRETGGGVWRRRTQNSVYYCACSCCGVTFSLGDLRSSAWRTWTWTGLGRWWRCIDWHCSRTESPGNQSSRTWKLKKDFTDYASFRFNQQINEHIIIFASNLWY